MEDFFVNVGLPLSEIMLAIAVLAALVLPLINSIRQPESQIKAGAGVVCLGICFLIGYAVAGDEITANYISFNVSSPGMSKFIGGMLEMMYLLFTVAIIGVAFSEIHKAMKS